MIEKGTAAEAARIHKADTIFPVPVNVQTIFTLSGLQIA